MEQRIKHTECLICGSSDFQTVFSVKDHSISQEIFEIVDCLSCGFRFTQNIPDQGSIGPYYQSEDYISHSDTKTGLINRLYHWGRSLMLQRKLHLIKKHAVLNKVLDVGSGTGYFLDFLQKNEYQAFGIEEDEGARAYAKKQFGVQVNAPEALLADQLDAPFGAITMWHVLEHVHKPDLYLQKFHRLLADQGVLLIAVPNHISHDGVHYQAYWAGYDVPRHLWHFSPKSMQALVERNGFQITEKIKMPLDPFYVSMLSERYQGKGFFGLLTAAFQGLKTHFKSLKNVDQASSLIYVIKKSS